MITSELARLVEAIHQEKKLPRDVVIDIIQSAVEAAARKALGANRDIEAQYDDDAGEVDIYEYKTVVDEVEEPDTQIAYEDAVEHDAECMVGDSLGFKVEIGTDELGRIAAQTAKQVISQKIRDAERDMTFNEFKDRKGELITGIVRRFEKQSIIVDLNRAEAILPRREQVPTETYRPGDRIQAYVVDINKATRQPQVVLSRTDAGLLMKLFEKEVPEIYDGIVRIEACAREPGHRAKIAVSSVDPQVDPVGACVGLKGSRVQAVVNECRGEMVDIIEWSSDPVRFIKNAIAPASVSMVYIDEGAHAMDIIVPDDHLAKAIGRRGQNVRLAQDLTGWKLEVHSESWHHQRVHESRDELARMAVIDADQVERLLRSGFQSAKEVADADPREIEDVLHCDAAFAQSVVDAADELVEQLIMEEAESRRGGRG
jgi:N utilization substance protein A